MSDQNEDTYELQAKGALKDGRISVSVDLGFGTLAIDVEQEALADDDRVDLLVTAIEKFETMVTQVLEALVEESEAQDA